MAEKPNIHFVSFRDLNYFWDSVYNQSPIRKEPIIFDHFFLHPSTVNLPFHRDDASTTQRCHTAKFFLKKNGHLTLQWESHWGAWLRGGMHTAAELDSKVWCILQSFVKIWISRWNRNRIRKNFSLFIRGLDGFESWKIWRSKISWLTPFNILYTHTVYGTET